MAIAEVDKSRRIVAVTLSRYLRILLSTLNLVLIRTIRLDPIPVVQTMVECVNGVELNCNHTCAVSNLHLSPPGL